MVFLNVKKLNVEYYTKNNSVHAVQDISFQLDQRDTIGIVGESGSGKSTLAMAILQLIPKNTGKVTGKIEMKSKRLLDLTPSEIREVRWVDIAAVFQKSMNALSPVHRVGNQLSDIYRLHEKNIPHKMLKQRIFQLLDMVNLPSHVYKAYPHELSGGMMQRVSIALGLMHNPKLLILDEATTALDVVTQTQILKELMELEEKMGLTRIMITHDLSIVASSCKKVAVMYSGQIVESGFVKDVLYNPLHPYTKSLIKSVPSLKGENRKITAIKGSIPDLSKPIEGCVFAARCPYAKEVCFQSAPENSELENNRAVKCHFVKGGEFVWEEGKQTIV
ncbi:ABC transporter ATP-binding protein [Oceanobacillus neutriphilus]|uniref:ABC transporter ATP-binding protein n=1 Tax=Oceanobacillus neutriphilus TaxID=531815 RepID=A0ABQ2NNT7_9BACI|nr:ABC transporter ATP-binding protein [Oceanobacillus neutriphilus]GGP06839.1 ABC transporter ATP-binding protein [Oceanobacillus neutriphilus]